MISAVNSQSGVYEKIVKHSNSFEVELNRGADYCVSAEADGYYSENLIIRRNIHPAFFGNCCLFGLGFIPGFVGMGIDYISGKMWAHTDPSVTVRLEKLKKDDKRGMILPLRFSYKNGTTEVFEIKMKPLPGGN